MLPAPGLPDGSASVWVIPPSSSTSWGLAEDGTDATIQSLAPLVGGSGRGAPPATASAAFVPPTEVTSPPP